MAGSRASSYSPETDNPFDTPEEMSEISKEELGTGFVIPTTPTLGLRALNPDTLPQSPGMETKSGSEEDQSPFDDEYAFLRSADNGYDADDETREMSHGHHDVVNKAGGRGTAGHRYSLFPGRN